MEVNMDYETYRDTYYDLAMQILGEEGYGYNRARYMVESKLYTMWVEDRAFDWAKKHGTRHLYA